jgi:hypothetical protein
MTTTLPALAISPDKVCFIIMKARQFDAKDIVTDVDSGSNPSDDRGVDVLEDHLDDPTQAELVLVIDDLNDDEQIDLVALTWLGRGNDRIDDWPAIHDEARRAHNRRTASYLLGIPQLADYLTEGLSQFGLSCEALEEGHL